MIKGECTDWQLALNLLQGAVGVPWRECPLDFRRERSGEERRAAKPCLVRGGGSCSK